MTRSRGGSLVALAALVALGAAAVWVASRTDADEVLRSAGVDTAPVVTADDLPVLVDSAPPVDADGWLNTEPLTADALVGRVVLYDFWTFGCINCVHTLPYVKAWHERYARDGLVVLSVHTPEFAYEKDPAAVAAFLADNDITYPVALDPDRVVWQEFGNHWWPAFYLHDGEGRRRYWHHGEGRYDATEDAIRALLGVAPEAPRAEVPA